MKKVFIAITLIVAVASSASAHKASQVDGSLKDKLNHFKERSNICLHQPVGCFAMWLHSHLE